MAFGDAIGRVINNITGRTAQNKWAANEAQKQRDFEERMSNTAIQRQTADAEAAGINPAMMFANSSSAGASTPSGAAAHSSFGGDSFLPNTLNSAANLVRAFNNDRNSSNDVTLGKTVKMMASIAKFLG